MEELETVCWVHSNQDREAKFKESIPPEETITTHKVCREYSSWPGEKIILSYFKLYWAYFKEILLYRDYWQALRSIEKDYEAFLREEIKPIKGHIKNCLRYSGEDPLKAVSLF